MKIGVLGTGEVGRALGKAFLTLGHEVMMGARSAANEKAVAWAKEMGSKATVGTFADAATFGEILVLATLGTANEEVLRSLGPDARGKILIDATNPLDYSSGRPPKLGISGHDSGGEQAQRLLPETHVVKAFNIIGNPVMFRPEFPGGPPDMFIAGNDESSKAKVTEILKEFGWGTVHDLGGIESSRYLEAMCMVWVLSAVKGAHWYQAFKMLRK